MKQDLRHYSYNIAQCVSWNNKNNQTMLKIYQQNVAKICRLIKKVLE